jgi:phage terminase large subunit GpA-like protein
MLPSLQLTETQRRLAAFKLPKRDRSPIYDWARRNIVLPESYATPGPFNVRLSPWLVPIFDALQNPLIRRVHFRKAVQIGGTLVADIWVPWLICNDAGPISWTMQTDEMIDRHAKSRLNPIFEVVQAGRQNAAEVGTAANDDRDLLRRILFHP